MPLADYLKPLVSGLGQRSQKFQITLGAYVQLFKLVINTETPYPDDSPEFKWQKDVASFHHRQRACGSEPEMREWAHVAKLETFRPGIGGVATGWCCQCEICAERHLDRTSLDSWLRPRLPISNASEVLRNQLILFEEPDTDPFGRTLSRGVASWMDVRMQCLGACTPTVRVLIAMQDT